LKLLEYAIQRVEESSGLDAVHKDFEGNVQG
jgi:hypothetical protein